VNSKKDLIIISLKNYKDQNQVVRYYHHYQFPGLKMQCDVPSEIGSLDVYETICKYQLINEYGLDTMKVDLFTVLKGLINPNTIVSNDQNRVNIAQQDIIRIAVIGFAVGFKIAFGFSDDGYHFRLRFGLGVILPIITAVGNVINTASVV
jgi:hypothetical protein